MSVRAAVSTLAVAILLAGCGEDPLEFGYGDRSGRSIDGFAVMTDLLATRFELEEAYHLGDHIDLGEFDTVVHFQDLDGQVIAGETEDLLADWLRGDDGRRVVVFLRNGRFSPWLLDRWHAEAQAALEHAEAESAERIERELAALAELAAELRAEEAANLGDREHFLGREVVPRTPRPATALRGPWAGPTPPFLRVTAHAPAHAGDEVLLASGADVLALRYQHQGGEVVVLTTTQPFLDGALVDPAARALAERVLDDLTARGSERLLLVYHLHDVFTATASASGDAADEPRPGIIATLFARAPFAGVAWHLLALLLLYVWWRARWMGRTVRDPRRHLETFGGHIDALARQLQARGRTSHAVSALAEYHGQDDPKVRTLDGALHASRRLTGAEPAPTDPSQEPS